jgi:preprotein translocase SecE subunit
VAKAVTRKTPTTGGGGDRVGYLRGVWDELKKVIWPTGAELWRMTGIVIATVIIFASLIGGADYALGWIVKPIYTISNNATNESKNSVTNTTTGGQTTSPPSAAPSSAAPTVTP